VFQILIRKFSPLISSKLDKNELAQKENVHSVNFECDILRKQEVQLLLTTGKMLARTDGCESMYSDMHNIARVKLTVIE